MSEQSSTPATGPVLIVGALVLVLVLLAVGIGQWGLRRWSSSASDTALLASQQPTIPAANSSLALDTMSGNQIVNTAASGMQMALQPGQTATALDPLGRTLEMRADASLSSPLLMVMKAYAPLTVIEPTGDYARYPVSNDGIDWVRVRCQEDGLVGWVNADLLTAGIVKPVAIGVAEVPAAQDGSSCAAQPAPTPTATPSG